MHESRDSRRLGARVSGVPCFSSFRPEPRLPISRVQGKFRTYSLGLRVYGSSKRIKQRVGGFMIRIGPVE